MWRNCNLHTSDGSIRWRSQDFPSGPVVKNLPANAEHVGLIPGWGTKLPCASGELRSCAITTEPVSSRAHMPHLERSLWATNILKNIYLRASLVAQMAKNLPATQETQVQSLGWEDPLEKGTATHSSIRAWRIPWTEEPGGLLSPWGCKELDMTERLTHTHIFFKRSIWKN